MQRYEFSQADARKGGRHRHTYELKLSRARMRHEERMEELRMLTTLLANPAIAGGTMYLLIEGIDTVTAHVSSASAAQQSAVSRANQFVTDIARSMPAPFNLAFQAGGSLGAGSIGGHSLLKDALLVYIATGGNVSGTIASTASLLGAIIPKP